MLPEVEAELPGLFNSGLLATQELRHGVPARSDWSDAATRGRPALGLRGRRLVEALGFSVNHLSVNTSLLTAGEDRRAVAVFLDEGETFDAPALRFDGVSPVSHALAVADREHLSWVVLTRASEIRLYTARPDTGVGRKGRAETYIEANLALLPDELAGYLHLLFSAQALADGGTLEEVLHQSADFAADLASRLRERVYQEAVPALARAVASRLDPDPDEDTLADAYEQALTILFRLLFVAYGEDKDLLPYRTNSRYADHSLKRIARRLAGDINAGAPVFDRDAADLWEDVVQLWRAIDRGNKGWGVPAYDGGLFSTDSDVNPAGAALITLELNDAEFGPALVALLVDVGDSDTVGPVDFRSLSVREFGTIYEGLLESELSVATTDLAVDKKGAYVPAKKIDTVVIAAGGVYLHNRSGARKATGSYFTKPFAVEHLLDHALEPALADHLAQLRDHVAAGDDAAAAATFFDFRCADIAMGSGHFLVAAVDRIEARLSDFLALNPIPGITAELDSLRHAATDNLGELAAGVEIETTSLLRRQVARRCVYGVDRNRIAVELARLAIWIHTFVPGLPLSFLDHNLVVGDSLTGVATIDEALTALGGDADDAPTLFRDQIFAFLGRASTALKRLGTIADVTVDDVKAAHNAHLEAQAQVAPATALFDLILADRLGEAELPFSVDEETLTTTADRADAAAIAMEVRALHFPVAFPEVFLRERPGFDCILGNPPWEKVKVEEHGFWSLRYPGLKALPQRQRAAEIAALRRIRPDLEAEYEVEQQQVERFKQLMFVGPFAGMGTGDPDLYKAFCWRFWHCCREGGAIGVVLPRSALSAKGSTPWREVVLARGAFTDTTMLLNSGGWVFEGVHQQYTVGLVSIRKGDTHKGEVTMRGPYGNLARFRQGVIDPPARFVTSEFITWSEGASFPLLPSPEAIAVFQKLRSHPRLDDTEKGFRCRPTRELHATDNKAFFRDPESSNGWPVYKGESIEILNGDTGVFLGVADPDQVIPYLQGKRLRQQRTARSAFSEFSSQWARDASTLPCRRARITFRDIARSTDTRTVIAALAPPHVFLTHLDPYLLWPRGTAEDESYLLGVLSSMPLDWYARRLVENHVSYSFLNALPIPDAAPTDPRRSRVAEIAARVSAVDERYGEWAAEVGVPVSTTTDEERHELLAELDAVVALLYGLTQSDVRLIYDTFHEGADYSQRRDAVIAHMRSVR
jgi:hypothetical protein